MVEHWCKEHKQEWVKKIKQGEPVWYSHPILDEDGEKTGQWCNEPKTETAKTPKEDTMSKEDWAEKDKVTRKSIERQKALSCAIDIAVAKIQAGGELTAFKILTIAKIFESYIENGVVVKDKE